MIKPLLSPTRITGNATTGLISAARNSIRNIQTTTDTISSSPLLSRPQKFGINFVEFFGSKKNSKILKKSLKTIRDSMVATFGIARSLKQAVSKGAGGIFGFVGKMFGGLKAAAGVFSLLASPVLKAILGIIAVGGIGTLLFQFKDQILGFVKDKASGFVSFIKDIIGNFIVSRRATPELQKIREDSKERIEDEIADAGDDKQQAAIIANNNEITLLEQRKKDFIKTNDRNDDPDYYDATKRAFDARIEELKTGKVDILTKGPFGGLFDFAGKVAQDFTAEKGVYSSELYAAKESDEKLKLIQKILRNFRSREDINKAKLIYQRELDSKTLDDNQKEQAKDIIKYLTEFGDNPFQTIKDDDKEDFLKKLSSVSGIKSDANNVSSVNTNSKTGSIVGSGSGSGTNVAMLPMNNQQSNAPLVRNDTGGLTGGSTMVIHPNVDFDNFVASFNKSNFNIV